MLRMTLARLADRPSRHTSSIPDRVRPPITTVRDATNDATEPDVPNDCHDLLLPFLHTKSNATSNHHVRQFSERCKASLRPYQMECDLLPRPPEMPRITLDQARSRAEGRPPEGPRLRSFRNRPRPPLPPPSAIHRATCSFQPNCPFRFDLGHALLVLQLQVRGKRLRVGEHGVSRRFVEKVDLHVACEDFLEGLARQDIG